jgi:hypothetical protein
MSDSAFGCLTFKTQRPDGWKTPSGINSLSNFSFILNRHRREPAVNGTRAPLQMTRLFPMQAREAHQAILQARRSVLSACVQKLIPGVLQSEFVVCLEFN